MQGKKGDFIMKNKKLLVLIPALMLTIGTLGACTGNKPVNPSTTDTTESDVTHVESVSLDKQTLELGIGDSESLRATVAPSNASNTAVTWSSDHPEIASVNERGKVTGVAVGSATITVTTQDGNKTATCAVTVVAARHGTVETDPLSIAEAIALAEGLEDNAVTDDIYFISGTVTEVASAYDATYGNVTLNFKEGDKLFVGYRLAASKEVGESINTNSLVLFKGQITKYVSSSNKVTLETKEKTGEVISSTGGDVHQTGHGYEQADPFTADEALAKAMTLENGKTESDMSYTKGVIKEIKDNSLETDYKNVTFTFVTTSGEFSAYRVKLDASNESLLPAAIKVGAEVLVKGQLTHYHKDASGTEGEDNYKPAQDSYQIAQGGLILSATGGDAPVTPTGHGYEQADPFTADEALAEALKLENSETAAFASYTKGVIKEITDNSLETTYKNVTFTFVTTSGEFSAYRAKLDAENTALTAAAIKVGAEVLVKGKLTHYHKDATDTAAAVDTYQIASGGLILSATGGTDPIPSEDHGYKQDDPFTADEALTKALTLGNGKTDSEVSYTKGTIKEVTENSLYTSFNNVTFSFVTTSGEFSSYRAKLGEGVEKSAVRPGAEVLVQGKLTHYHKDATDTAAAVDTYQIASGGTILSATGGAEVTLTGLTVTPEAAELEVGKTLQLAVAPVPTEASLAGLEFVSADGAKATVSATGLVTGVAEGEVKITAKVGNVEKAATITVVVPAVPNNSVASEKFDFKSSLTKYEAYDATKFEAFLKGSSELGKNTNLLSHSKDGSGTDPLIGASGGSGDAAWSNYNLLKLGSSSKNTKLTLTFDEGFKIDKLTVRAFGWAGKTNKLAVNGGTAQTIADKAHADVKAGLADGSVYTEYTFELAEASNVIVLQSTLCVMIDSIVFHNSAAPAAKAVAWYQDGTGNQANHIEGAGIWLWVNYKAMGYADFAAINAAKADTTVKLSTETSIVEYFYSDDVAAEGYCRLYVVLSAAVTDVVVTVTIGEYTGSVTFVGGAATAYNA